MNAIYIIAFLIIYLEMAFKGVILESAGVIDKLCTLLFSVPIVLTLNLICSVLKQKISKIILTKFLYASSGVVAMAMTPLFCYVAENDHCSVIDFTLLTAFDLNL